MAWGKNPYRIVEDQLICKTRKGEYFYLSASHEHLVSLYTWTRNGRGYFLAKIYGKIAYLHRMVTACEEPEMVVDHINGHPWDNREENLRIITQKENMNNRRDNVSRRNK